MTGGGFGQGHGAEVQYVAAGEHLFLHFVGGEVSVRRHVAVEEKLAVAVPAQRHEGKPRFALFVHDGEGSVYAECLQLVQQKSPESVVGEFAEKARLFAEFRNRRADVYGCAARLCRVGHRAGCRRQKVYDAVAHAYQFAHVSSLRVLPRECRRRLRRCQA